MQFEDNYFTDRTTVVLADTIGLEKKIVPEGFKLPKELKCERKLAYLISLINKGLDKRFSSVSDKTALNKRIEEELYKYIFGGCENYLIIVSDIISWAKENNILVKASRNCSSSSLVLYCLGITDINPIENGLIFERFYNPSKEKYPDIDIEVDLCEKQRVIDYIKEKYADVCVSVIEDEEDYFKYDRNCFMRFDLIGSQILSELKESEERIKKTNTTFSLDSIPLDDEKTFKMLSSYDQQDLYQLQSLGVLKYLKELKPSSIEDLSALISLYRPGFLSFLPQFINSKNNKGQIRYIDPALQEYLEETHGQVIYQEQIINILSGYANFDIKEANDIRKLMQKKLIGKHPEIKKVFVARAIEMGHNQELASSVYDYLCEMACYAYPKAMAINLARLSYVQAYLKCRH